MDRAMGKPNSRSLTLRRYTNIPSLFHILYNRKITLLSPHNWEDKNDVYSINQFKERKKLDFVLTVCFSEAAETFHHWKVFTHGSEGVCIVFKRKELLSTFENDDNIRTGSVKHVQIHDLEKKPPKVDDLPFTKRFPYRDEREFRIIYLGSGNDSQIETKGFAIDLTCIKSITLNPWLNNSLCETIIKSIKSIDGCEKIKVHQTTILENQRWKSAVLEAV
jgi:hypothetical protein